MITLERPVDEADDHEAPGKDPDLAGVPRSLRILLAGWVGADAVLVLGLAVRNATLTSTAWDLIGTALLSAIGITCVLALVQIAKGSDGAALTAMVSQVFVAGLSVYIWMVDQRSPESQLMGVTGIALAVGGIALLWVLYLGRYARGAFSKGAAVAVALIPLVGLGQFWMQTEYLPTSARPLIDISTELSPTGSTGPIIHLSAKATLHNRGSVQADVHAALIRVTAYPVGTPAEPASTERLLAGLTPYGRILRGEYRETPALPADSQLLYANLFAAPYDESLLPPGGTVEQKVVIDIDSRKVRLVRLSVSGVFVTRRLLKDTHSCYPPQISFAKDPFAFFDEAGKVHDFGDTKAGVLCSESQFASTGAIQDLVSDHPMSRVFVMVAPPAPTMNAPDLMPFFGTRETLEDPLRHIDAMSQIDKANPAVIINSSAEYVPSDADVHPGAR
ncbi:hypothetical protein [Mycolicibacter kumamotonensis]|uniref:Uncharacterized protein n=2 Tax=Mycolicibacter kumamotonensis TaxID=354243 RepID=A0A1B8SLW4_9MYCO|nr:hypothetical protein [Mycolicibacter kumamotonensis]NDJ91044.1 hypothetical protein [Mycolicibacter kumamotonensis]OBY33735.1 hypothetical protein ACT18_02220 [Mycolicibacter kumamotonensis]